MNNKENAAVTPTGGELSTQQRARISQSFRAAKALLARKRPRFESPEPLLNNHRSGNEKEIESIVRVNGIKRVPLSDISTNVLSPVLFKLPKKNGDHGSEVLPNTGTLAQCSSKPCPEDASRIGIEVNGGGFNGIKRVPLSDMSTNVLSPVLFKLLKKNGDHGSEVLPNNGILVQCSSKPRPEDARRFGNELNCGGFSVGNFFSFEEESDLNSFVTPLRKHSWSIKFESQSNNNSSEALVSPGLSDSLTTSNVLGDDLDELILAQIDTICEEKSATKLKQEDNDESNLVQKDRLYEEQSVSKLEREDNAVNRKEIVTEICKNDNPITNLNGIDDSFKSVQGLVSVGDQLCGVKEVGKSKDELTKNMPDEYIKYIQSLNDSQREAACSDISIPLVIVAGPGSGKTSTMVGRVLKLLNEGIGPSHILAMTFTTAAAAEMRERIATVAGKAAAKELIISTFHSFSLQLCRLHAEKLCRTPDFLIYGHGQQRKAIIEAVRLSEEGKIRANNELHNRTDLSDINSPKHFKDKSKKWLKFVTQAKSAGRSPEYFRKLGDETGAIILQNYNDILKSCNALDYHDFIINSVQLLTDFPEVFKECQESWKAIVIDEFQDTSSMQYGFLRILATHKRITIVGDEDQSIFGFNGADVSGFDSFRKDFLTYKEVRLNKNYRSTRCIVEAASFLIRNNIKRCNSKDVLTDNSSGSKITIKECCNEEAQCAFVVDKILELASGGSSSDKRCYGNIAVLYRRQVTGKIFQTAFRNRKIPFNMHGVAFYRKKVVRAIIAMLSTTLPGCDDGPFRQVFKALLPFEKEEKKKVIEHIDKVSTVRRCSFISAAGDIFSAKISGTFKRSQLTQGRKVLLTLDMISKLVNREQSISAVITSVTSLIPQKYLLEQRAVLDVDGGKLLNEDNDIRPVLQYLLDDVSIFLRTIYNVSEGGNDSMPEGKGCITAIKAFVDYISVRERENFRSRKNDNEDSVTLTTIHQSKGLEWDTVFIVKTNEAEIPLLHEYNGTLNENGTSIEEERRLLYVAMTRARKKLFMLYLLMDSNWQVLQPSRFLKEIPRHLLENQDELISVGSEVNYLQIKQKTPQASVSLGKEFLETDAMQNNVSNEVPEEFGEVLEYRNSSNFLKRFCTEGRSVVSHLFHQWAKKPAFLDPKRLLNKVGFAIDERLRAKKSTHKDVLRELKSCLTSDEAYEFAVSVLKWEQIPAEKRAYITREKQEHFQKLRIESAMGSSEATPKQIGYLQSLGCTIVPTSRLHASRLIEEYKSL